MKIAFDYQAFVLPYGGVSRYCARIAEGLADSEEVSIFASYYRNHYISDLPSGLVRGKKIKAFPPKCANAFIRLNHYLSNRAIKKWKPDVVHETYYSPYKFIKRNTLRIVTVHDMIHELYPNSFGVKDKTSIAKRAAVESADHIICVSNNTKNDLIRLLKVDPEKITVIHLAADRNKALIKNNKIRKPYLLYVGHRGTYKNFTALIEAFSSSINLKNDFDIVTFGGGPFSEVEVDFMQAKGLREDQISNVSGDDDLLSSLYANALAFVYPSLYEGFGLPPLEAMANDCPVISSNVSSMPEVIADAGAYFDPKSICEITKVIEDVVYSPGKREELIRKGTSRLATFSWDKCAKKTLDVYEKGR